MKKAVVFDMDGVLFDTESMSSNAWMRLAKERGLGDIGELTEDCIGRNRTDIILQFKRRFGEGFDADGFLNAGRDLMNRYIAENGLPLMKGAREILQYLKENGFAVGVASSSGRKTILRNLELSGLAGYFQAVTGGDEVTLSKPKPDIYLEACEAVGVPPQKAIAVEDSPNGIRAAYRAGMKPVMIPDLVQPDQEISGLLFQKYDSLLDLKDAILSLYPL